MNRIVKILMNRDNMTEAEARELVGSIKEDIQQGIEEGFYSYEDVACIIEDELGIEPDYIEALLF